MGLGEKYNSKLSNFTQVQQPVREVACTPAPCTTSSPPPLRAPLPAVPYYIPAPPPSSFNGLNSSCQCPIFNTAGAMRVDGSAVTQPVSGTVTVTGIDIEFPAGAATAENQTTLIGHVDGIQALLAAIDASLNNIEAAGGASGVQYTEGAAAPAITGTAALMEGAGNTLLPIQGTVVDGLLVNLGMNNDVTVAGGSTAANQTTIIGHVDGIEALLTQIETNTSGGGGGGGDASAANQTTIIGHVDGIEALLTQIETNTSGGGGGDATAANQTTLIGHVDGIEPLLTTIDSDTSLLAGTVSGAELQVDVVSSALPAGAATEANQTTMLGHVDGIEALLTQIQTNTGTSSLAKSEDSLHTTGDVGVMMLGVRTDTRASLVSATSDYVPFQSTSKGDMRIDNSSVAGVGSFPAGFLRVTDEPQALLYDPFDGAIDTTNTWTATSGSGGILGTTTAGMLTLGTGVLPNGFSKVESKYYFKPTVPSWIGYSFLNLIPDLAAPLANSYRYWGSGTTPAVPNFSNTVNDGVGFELLGDGKIYAVVYAAGVRNVIQDLSAATGNGTQPTDALGHRYIIYVRTDRIYWYIDSLDTPVAVSNFVYPTIQTLPELFLAVGGPTPPTSSGQIQSVGATVWDTGKNASQISDGAYPWRKAVVTSTGRLLIGHMEPSAQVWKSFNATTTQTGAAIWTPAAGKKIAISNVIINAYGTTPGRVLIWLGAAADTTYTAGTDPLVVPVSFAPSASLKGQIVVPFTTPFFSPTADHVLRITTDAAMSIDVAVFGYEFV